MRGHLKPNKFDFLYYNTGHRTRQDTPQAKKMDAFYSTHPHINEPFRGKYKPHIVMAEDSKWIVHQNWAYMPSWCTYRKEHPSEEQARKQMIEINEIFSDSDKRIAFSLLRPP